MAMSEDFKSRLKAETMEKFSRTSDPKTIVNWLRTTPIGDMVDGSIAAGDSPDFIISKVIGEDTYKAMSESHGDNAVIKGVKGAGDAAADMGRGARRTWNMATGDDEDLAEVESNIAAAHNDPRRLVRDQSVAGQVGGFAAKAAPSVVAAVATGGASLPAQAALQAGIGAGMGLVEDSGNPLANAAIGGGIGAAAVPASAAIGKGAQALLSKSGNALTSRGAAIEAKETAKKVATEEAASAKKLLDKELAKRVGLDDYDGPVDSAMVKQATDKAKVLFDEAASGKPVQMQGGFKGLVRKIIDEDLETVPKSVKALLDKDKFNGFVKSSKWTEQRSKIAAAAHAAEGSDRMYLGQIVDAMDDAMARNAAPEQLAKLTKARDIWKNLQPLGDLVKKSGDTGNFSWSNFRATVAKHDKFKTGDAPLQDLMDLAEKAMPSKHQLLDKLDELKPTTGLGKIAGNLVLDAIPFGNTAANIIGAGNNPALLNSAGNALTSAGNAVGNPTAQQLLGQLAAKGTEAKFKKRSQ